jgi:hypothetical protein
VLSNEDKATKRAEIQERRQKNTLAKTLFPIAHKQSKKVSSQANIASSDYEESLGYAMLGIAEAMSKSDCSGSSLRPGFYSYVKQYASGYSLNYLRDKSRAVRLPRDLTLAYLAEQRALRDVPGYRHLCDTAKAEHLNLDLDVLVESRSAIALHGKTLEGYDACVDHQPQDQDMQAAAEHVQSVLDAGIRTVAMSGKLSQTEVSEQFYKSLALVLGAYHA